MANMKKFTPSQQKYVTELLIENSGLKMEARKLAYDHECECTRLNAQLERLTQDSESIREDLRRQRDEARALHGDLLNAVEDYLEADNDKALVDRRYAGAIGRLGDLHSEHSRHTQDVNQMTFTPDPGATFGWRKR